MTKEEQAEHKRQEQLAKKAKEAAEVKAVDAKNAADTRARLDKLSKDSIVLVGTPGGVFNIRASGLGLGGTMTVGGIPVKITRWDDQQIRGVLPPNAAGDVMLNGVKRGVFPVAKPSTTQKP